MARKDVPNATPSSVHVETLVEIVRSGCYPQFTHFYFTNPVALASNNPQTYHQALVLISTLSRLAPESVLRDIMPIFTFMGSNVFHRDDAYSFNVVQKVCTHDYSACLNSLILIRS